MKQLLTRSLSQVRASNSSLPPEEFFDRLHKCSDVVLLRGIVECLVLIPETSHAEGYADGAFRDDDEPADLQGSWEQTISRSRLEALKARIT